MSRPTFPYIINQQKDPAGQKPIKKAKRMEEEKVTLELKNGDLITPRSLFDLMEVVEEYMGCEVRQYLEGYMEGTEQPEAIPGEEGIREHYRDVLTNLLDKVDDVDMEMQRTRIDRETVEMHLSAMRRMIRREL